MWRSSSQVKIFFDYCKIISIQGQIKDYNLNTNEFMGGQRFCILAKTFNLNKVKITFPSSKFFELSKPPTYNSNRNLGEMLVYLSYS